MPDLHVVLWEAVGRFPKDHVFDPADHPGIDLPRLIELGAIRLADDADLAADNPELYPAPHFSPPPPDHADFARRLIEAANRPPPFVQHQEDAEAKNAASPSEIPVGEVPTPDSEREKASADGPTPGTHEMQGVDAERPGL